MIYLTLLLIASPVVAILWALGGLLQHRRTSRKHEFMSLLGAFLMLPVGIMYIGALEVGWRWLFSFPRLVFGAVLLAGIVTFVRAELAKARDRGRPQWACPNCGYDCRGLPEGKCPECGPASRPEEH